MRLLELPQWLTTWGLPYVEVEGWQTRGAELPAMPSVVIGHHTATPAGAKGDLPTLRILRDGRADLRGPLCHLALSRSGVVHVIASGKANHAGAGRWIGVPGGEEYDARLSAQTIGIEAEHPGKGSWPQVQIDAFDRLAACLLWGIGSTWEAYCHHKEWALPRGRKVDCNFDPAAQRGRIARLLVLGPHPRVEIPTPPPEEGDMRVIHAPGRPTCLLRADGRLWPLDSNADVDAYRAAGVGVYPLTSDQWDTVEQESQRIAAAKL